MRLLGCAALLITLGTVNACALLPELEPGVCGNGVVEAQAGEECDGFPLDDKTRCIEPDEKNACRIPCDLDVEPHLRCPAGYACGLNELCRAPSGTFNEAPSSYVEEDVLQILIGDFDGDRMKDVLTTGAAEQRIHYYDKSGALVTRSSIPGSYARPAVGQLTHGGDSADDFTIGVGPGISVMRGQSGRSAAATHYPVPLVNTTYAYSLFALEVNALDETSPGHEVLGVFQEFGQDMAFVGNASNASGELIPEAIGPAFPIPGPLAGEVTTGNLYENGPGASCEEAVFGFFGGKQIYVIAPCGSPKAVQLNLPGDAVLLSQPRLGDMNNDGLADIVFGGFSMLDVGGSNQKCHFVGIAYNNGDGQFASDPNLLNLGAGPALVADYVDGQTCLMEEDTPFLFPLAAGDVNNDGAGDYIDPYGVHINSGGPKQLPTFALKDIITPVATLWTSAQIAEFTGDKFPDVVAGSELIHGIDFLLGTGSPTLPFNKIKIETPHPTGKIMAGFFDGDLILDVAIAERIPLDESASPTTSGNALSILFGRQFAAPEPPVRMGQMDKIHQIIPGNFNQYTNVSDFTTDLLVVSGRSEAPVFGAPVADQMGAPVPSTFFLVGSADRRILSPYRLHTGDGPTHPLLTVTGQFDGDKEGNADVAVLSAEEITLEGSSGSDAEEQDYRIWLLPTYSGAEIPMLDIEATSPRATLSDAFGAEAIGPEVGTLEIPSIKAAVVDLEGDGVDEIVAFIPVQGSFDADPPVPFKLWTLVLKTETVMASGSRRFIVADKDGFDDLYFPLRVESVDINGDGLRDIVGLFYDPPKEPNVLPSSRIVAFVNKGEGEGFTMTRANMPTPMDEIADPKNPVEDFPYAFAVLNADTDPSTEIVVFTKSYAYTSEFDATGGALTEPVRNPSLPGAIAAGAGDMTGDGVDDLVVSDGLSLRMFKGQPTTPDPR